MKLEIKMKNDPDFYTEPEYHETEPEEYRSEEHVKEAMEPTTEQRAMKIMSDFYDLGSELAKHIDDVFRQNVIKSQVTYALSQQLAEAQKKNRELAAIVAGHNEELGALRNNAVNDTAALEKLIGEKTELQGKIFDLETVNADLQDRLEKANTKAA